MKLLGFCLSLRTGSFNRKLLDLAIQTARAEIDVEMVNLKDFELPAYDADIEQSAAGIPAAANELAKLVTGAKGLLIASPEYNFSMPGHFKNTFDWLSRVKPSPWSRRTVLLMSASPSLVGGNRGLWTLRVPFEACGAFVYPDMFSLASAHQAFADAQLKDAALQQRLAATVSGFVRFTKGFAP